ncbi:YALI0D09333p [Yarrowia lipolytica CLIB122]|uniref:YALI0D09333p n=2 Tax=Yarrowia lipolytica TaxID=4952 RepID=B5FVE4_YARLI|nr:YALI0D09333p [Yarrowia lipolytica CLIB122]AOW03826.1 hypothetical protein YALI1_D11934g [Yarrowia lipolytica]CAR64316.1 YALI0D09333p [Yarrowia lipolytica CLIB122]|eukprot:XP_002143051.1 YALI0D09333p [Yarrowia lipolytica CLIB122]
MYSIKVHFLNCILKSGSDIVGIYISLATLLTGDDELIFEIVLHHLTHTHIQDTTDTLSNTRHWTDIGKTHPFGTHTHTHTHTHTLTHTHTHTHTHT